MDLDETLRLLNGGETQNVRFAQQFDPNILDDQLKGPLYKINPRLPNTSIDVVQKLCDISSNAYVVRAFADKYSSAECGLVNQSLASAFRVLYNLFLEQTAKLNGTFLDCYIQLEEIAHYLQNAKLLVSKLVLRAKQERERKRVNESNNFAVRASNTHILHNDAQALVLLKGGAVLKELSLLLRSNLGDQQKHNLYLEFLKAASEPYLSQLKSWLYFGDFEDPFDEFAVLKTFVNSETKFSVRVVGLPLMLDEPNVYKRMLNAGVLINTLKQANLPLPMNTDFHISSVEDQSLVEAVERCYLNANSALINGLRQSAFNINSAFVALFDFYLSMRCVPLLKFLDEFELELNQPILDLDFEKIKLGFDIIKEESAEVWNPFVNLSLTKTSLRDELANLNENTTNKKGQLDLELKGIDCLNFEFQVPFPLNQVIQSNAIKRYQFILRYFLKIRHTKKMLINSFSLYTVNRNVTLKIKNHWWFKQISILRHAKMQFVDALCMCTLAEACEEEYFKFTKLIDNIDEIDILKERHLELMNRLLECCLLYDHVFIKHISRMLTNCQKYAMYLETAMELLVNSEGDFEDVIADLDETRIKFDEIFRRQVQKLVEMLEISNSMNAARLVPCLQALV